MPKRNVRRSIAELNALIGMDLDDADSSLSASGYVTLCYPEGSEPDKVDDDIKRCIFVFYNADTNTVTSVREKTPKPTT